MTQVPSIEIFPDGSTEDLTLDFICPADKSVTHRCVMFAAMAKGVSRIYSPLLGADCRSTMAAFGELGVEITISQQPSSTLTSHNQGAKTSWVEVKSPGWDGWHSPLKPLDFGNSGTTARLMTGILSATPGLFAVAWGDASLSLRPMGRVVQPLRRSGARIFGRSQGAYLPMAIEGSSLVACHHQVDKASAQVKSALLLAGLNIDGEISVTLPSGSRDHTEKALVALGASIKVDHIGTNEHIVLKGPFRPRSQDYQVPGDPSSAAFFIVLGAIRLRGAVTVRGVLSNATRTGFLTVLKQMGISLSQSSPAIHGQLIEPVQDLTIHGGGVLKAVHVDAHIAPTLIDEIPILAVAALFAQGVSRFCGLGELRVKESDRLAKTIELIKAAGGEAWAEADDLLVKGPIGQVQPFVYDPSEDHRLAMAAAILAKRAEGACKILDPHCVAVSFPDFFELLGSKDKTRVVGQVTKDG